MAIIKTHLYNISFDHQDLINVLIEMHKLKDDVYPQDSQKIANNVKGVAIMERNNPYDEPLNQLYVIFDGLGLSKEYQKYRYHDLDLASATKLINEVDQKLTKIIQIKDDLIHDRDENIGAITLLKQIALSQIEIDDIKNAQYITCRFGYIPRRELEKIRYYNDFQFIYRILSEDEHRIWIMYTALKDKILEIDNIFYSMSFTEVKLPDFAHGKINDAITELQNEKESMDQYIIHMDGKAELLKTEYQDRLVKLFCTIANLKELYDQAQYVVDFSHKAAIYTFSSLDMATIASSFAEISSVKVLELPSDIYIDRNIIPPILVKNSWLTKPFESLIHNQQGDTFDGSALLTGFSLVAAIIFLGDIGFGLVMVLIGGLLMLLKHRSGAGILTRLGVASAIGGLLYGSCFNSYIYKTPLDKLLSPIHNLLLFVLVYLIGLGLLKVIKKITRRKLHG